MISLRVRVALVTAVVEVVLLGSGSWVLNWRIAVALDQEFDHLTIQRLTASASGLEFEDGDIEMHGQGPAVTALALVGADGVRLSGQPWLQPPTGLVVGQPILGNATTADGEPCRTAWVRVMPEHEKMPTGKTLDVGIAMSLTDLREQQAAIGRTLVAGALLVAIAGILVLTMTLGRMLAPHARLAEQVGNLDPRRPGRRLEVASLPPELRGIAERINELCDRLERAYGLATSFHAAAAHELRTPIAGLRATIEVAAQPGGEAAAALATCHAIALQMQARIDNLLMAARIDAGQLVPRRDEVDVHAMLRQAWQAVEERAHARGLAVTWDLAGSGLAVADPEALRMVLANLVDNAVSHALGSQPLSFACADKEGRLAVILANPVVGMTAESAPLVFERGWRADGGSSAYRHAGLGMGISRELVGLMAGRIEARFADGLFIVEVSLPAPGVFEYW